MDEAQDRAVSFGIDAAGYDAARPAYPDALYDDLLARTGPSPRVLEVGAGTGLATRDLAPRAVGVLAVEPDERMAALLRGRALPGVEVVVGRFEDVDLDVGDGAFDLVASAQAWHWLDPVAATAAAATALRPGGVLAIWWNTADPERSESMAAADEVHERLEPELVETSSLGRGRRPSRHTEPIGASPRFDTVEVLQHRWVQRYRPDDYVALLRTHSGSRALPPDRRERLLDAVHRTAVEHGGVELRYVTDCTVATRS